MIADPAQPILMSNGHLYHTQGLHPPPYATYVTAPPQIKQEYTSSPTVDDQQSRGEGQTESNTTGTYSPPVGKRVYYYVDFIMVTRPCNLHCKIGGFTGVYIFFLFLL